MKTLRVVLALCFLLGMLGTAFAATTSVAGPSNPALERPINGVTPVFPPPPPPPPPPVKK